MTDFRAEREIMCRVQCIRDHLDGIDGLLPKQDPKVSGTVHRLTVTCKQLTEENRQLKKDLTTAHRQLAQFQIGWCPFDCASSEQLIQVRNDLEQALRDLKGIV